MIDKKELGKLFFCGFRYFEDSTCELIRKYNPAGLLVYPGDMKNSGELVNVFERISELQKEGMRFMISSDHEGGQLETIPLVPTAPGNFVFGNNGDAGLTGKYATVAAKYMKLTGFNMVFSPVLDMYHEGTSPAVGFRTFGGDPEKVAENASAMVSGYEKNGIAACVKHFPGHGRAKQDSHESLPNINVSLDELLETDLYPFRKCVENGVESVMTAHLIFPDIDSYPATISRVFINDILRKKFGFDGIVITDALEMKAMADNYSKEEIIKRFFDAGGDMLLIGWGNLMFEEYVNTLYRMVENGEVNIRNIRKSIERVDRVLDRYCSNENIGFIKDFSFDSFEYDVENVDSKANNVYLIAPRPVNLSPADITARDYSMIEENIGRYFKLSKTVNYDLQSGEFLDSCEDISQGDLVIDIVIDSFRNPSLMEKHKSISQRSSNTVYLILRDPEDIKHFREYNYIATFSSNVLAVSKAMELIRP